MIGKIYHWDQGERLAVVREAGDRECQEDCFCIRQDRTLWCQGNIWKEFELDTAKIQNGDILEISEMGTVSMVYAAGTSEADIFVTNQCNSNCVMCPMSEDARKKKKQGRVEWLRQYIRLLPPDIAYVNVTGGEPTLAGDHFLEIMCLLKEKFQNSGFQLLTNGRSVADQAFFDRMLPCLPTGIRFAIPFHCAREEIHDGITRAKGSFRQTVQGIHNLLKQDMKVELRIVLSQKNIPYLAESAEYIIRHFQGVFCVNFIAMEMMGNAARNRAELWEDYPIVFQKAKKAILLLVQNGIDVQLYNFPLCAVEKGFWHIAAKSITDYKIRYMEACDLCKVRSICGGFFYSTKQLMHPEVVPVRDDDETELL